MNNCKFREGQRVILLPRMLEYCNQEFWGTKKIDKLIGKPNRVIENKGCDFRGMITYKFLDNAAPHWWFPEDCLEAIQELEYV